MEPSKKGSVRASQPGSRHLAGASAAKQPLITPLRTESRQSGRAGFDLILMRHGIATNRSGQYASSDSKRPLTPKGKKRVQQIARGLKYLGYEPDWIVTSPLTRARETAEIVAASARRSVAVDPCPALRPGGSFEELLTYLGSNPRRRRILLVGHEPDLGLLAARLIGAGPAANLMFKKGGCCLIHCDHRPSQATGDLLWWLTPRLLRALR